MNETPEERYRRLNPELPIDLMEEKPKKTRFKAGNTGEVLKYVICLLFGVIIGLMI